MDTLSTANTHSTDLDLVNFVSSLWSIGLCGFVRCTKGQEIMENLFLVVLRSMDWQQNYAKNNRQSFVVGIILQ